MIRYYISCYVNKLLWTGNTRTVCAELYWKWLTSTGENASRYWWWIQLWNVVFGDNLHCQRSYMNSLKRNNLRGQRR